MPKRSASQHVPKDLEARFEEISQVALAILVAGCYYGTQAHGKLWIDLLQRAANPGGEPSGSVALLKLRRYPALLLS